MEYGLNEGGGEVGSGLARQRSSVDCPLEATQKTGMCLELNLHDKQEGNPHSDRPPKVIQGQKPLLTSTVTVLICVSMTNTKFTWYTKFEWFDLHFLG